MADSLTTTTSLTSLFARCIRPLPKAALTTWSSAIEAAESFIRPKITGHGTFVKPANDLPLASIIGVLIASIVVVLLSLLIPQQVSDLIGVFVNPKIVLLVLFIIVFAIVALTAKFYTKAFMAISKALSWPPLGVIFAIFCLLQGFLLLVVGVSISGYF